MQATRQIRTRSNAGAKAGYVISVLASLLLLLDGSMKLGKPAPVVDAMNKLGYSLDTAAPIGLLLIACTLIYAVPRTSRLGAILLTGYLGGAVATHVRAGTGAFSVVFPVLFGSLLWLGLMLRDPKIREFFGLL